MAAGAALAVIEAWPMNDGERLATAKAALQFIEEKDQAVRSASKPVRHQAVRDVIRVAREALQKING